MTAQKHDCCRSCDTSLPAAFFDVVERDAPLANNLCSEGDHHDERFSLRLVRCPSCGLLQLDTVVDPSVMFSHYLYRPSQSQKTVAHFDSLAETITRREGRGLVVDVGSNDGCLLGHLKARGWNVLGVDPAENLAREATAAGILTMPSFFTRDVAADIASRLGSAQCITACNVFAHTPDWRGFLAAVDELLAPDGVLVLEFPYGPIMLRDGTFDLIYHEHFSYPSVGSLAPVLSTVGMHVVDIEMLPTIHGGSVRVWTRRGGAALDGVENFVRTEQTTYSEDACRVFVERAELVRRTFRSIVRQYREEGRRVVGYTAPAKAVTLIEACALDVGDIAHIVDDNPLKQGRMLPGSHIPIVASSQDAVRSTDAVVVFAWNVAEDVVARLPQGAVPIVPSFFGEGP